MGRREVLVAAAATAGLGIVAAILAELERRCRRAGEGGDDAASAPVKSSASSAGRGSAAECRPGDEVTGALTSAAAGAAVGVAVGGSGAATSSSALCSSNGLAGLAPNRACLLPNSNTSSLANNGSADGTHNLAGMDFSSQQLLESLAMQTSSSKQPRAFWTSRGNAWDPLRYAPGAENQRLRAYASSSSGYADLAEMPSGASPGAGAVGGGARADPMQKVRLDQLFRYLDARHGDQDPHQSQQRQRLQRKLLQRSGGRAAEADSAPSSPMRAIEAGDTEDRLQDSRQMEELLRELGESPTTPKGRRRPKAKRSGTRASAQSQQRGSRRGSRAVAGGDQPLEVTSPLLVTSPERSLEVSPIESPATPAKAPWPSEDSPKPPAQAMSPRAEKPLDTAADATSRDDASTPLLSPVLPAVNSQKAFSPHSSSESKELKDAALAESIRRVLAVGPPPEPPPEPPEPSPEPPPTEPEGPPIMASSYNSGDFEEWSPGDASNGVQGFQVVANRKARRKRGHREQNVAVNGGASGGREALQSAANSAGGFEEAIRGSAGLRTGHGTGTVRGSDVVDLAGHTGDAASLPEDVAADAPSPAVSRCVDVHGRQVPDGSEEPEHPDKEPAFSVFSSTIREHAALGGDNEATSGELEQLHKEDTSAGVLLPSQPSTPATFSVESVVSVTDSAPGSSSLADSAGADLATAEAREEAAEVRIEAEGAVAAQSRLAAPPCSDSNGHPCSTDGNPCACDFRTAVDAVDGGVPAESGVDTTAQDDEFKRSSGRIFNSPSRRRTLAENVSQRRRKQLWADMSDDEEDFPSMQEMMEYGNPISNAYDTVA